MHHTRRSWISVAAAGLLSRSASAVDAPKRGMIVRSARPEDLEMPLDGFGTWLTPADRLFVRHHHYAAHVNASNWKLELDGLTGRPLSFSLDQLRRMPRHEVVAVMECAGNGRGLYEPSMPGLQWKYGAVGNCRWTGVRLRDLLQLAGVKPEAREVLLDGADRPIGTMPKFQRTIPLTKAMDPDTLLAYDMNGEPLPALHGFPLRLIAPGWASDSWTKWLSRITLLDKEFDGFYMKTAYRHPGRATTPGQAVDPAAMQPVTALHVKSVIAHPLDGAVITSPLVVRGAAWSGPSPVTKVEVSVDGGRTWSPAHLGSDQARYAWRLWEFKAPALSPGFYNILARATDASGDVQPFAPEWNPSGYQWNVVHQIGINLGQGTAKPVAAHSPVDPPSDVKESCVGCHEMDVITQQRLTRGQWEKEVDKMARWGAQVKPESRESILKFLSDHYGDFTRR